MSKNLSKRLINLKDKRLMRDGLWLMIAYGVSALAGLGSVRLFTELASHEVFGAANLILGILTLAMHVVVAPITQTQLRYHSSYLESGSAEQYHREIIRLAAAASICVIVIISIIFLLRPQLRYGAEVSIIGLFAIWVAVSTLRNVMINRVQAERRQQVYALWIGAEAILLMIFTGSSLWLWPTVQGYIIGQILAILFSTACFLVGGYIYLRGKKFRLNELQPDESQIKTSAWVQVKKYGMPFVPFALLGWMSTLADRYVLAANLDTQSVGQYVASYAIASRIPSLVGALMSDTFRPALFESANRGDADHTSLLFIKWLTLLSGAVIGLILLLYLSADFVAQLLLAEPYRANAPAIMCWIAAGCSCTVLAQAVENRLLSFGASQALIWTKISSAVANVSAAWILIPSFGIIGAAKANAVGQATALISTIIILGIISTKFNQPNDSK